jgi:general secretion pathway protein G
MQNINQRRRRRGGFTLIEVLLVLVILVILGSFAGVAIFQAQQGALEDQAKVQIGNLNQAVKLYMLHMNTAPQSLNDLLQQPSDSRADRWKGPYLESKEIPKDPWDNDYQYEGSGTEYRISSMGPDGASGTDDDISI